MNMDDMFSFEPAPWESYILHRENMQISAAHFLTLLEGCSEDDLEEAFLALENNGVVLDIFDLPIPVISGETAVQLRREKQLAEKGIMLHDLEDGDPLRLYLEELAAIPAFGDAQSMAAELAGKNSAGIAAEELCTALVNLSLHRVVELAAEYTGHGVLLMDLIQEGSLGLWQGIATYTGGDFEACRDRWIHRYMAKAVTLQARDNGVGQKLRQAMEDYRMVDEKLLAELGRNPTMEEIAEAMHMSLQETAMVADMLQNARMLQRVKQPEPEQLPQEEDQAVEDTAYFQMRQRITELLSVLPEQEAKVLALRYGLENGRPMTPQQAGQALGMTPEEVNRAEAVALAKLRKEN